MSYVLIDTQDAQEPTPRQPLAGLLSLLGRLFKRRERAVYLSGDEWKAKRNVTIWNMKAKKGQR